MTAPRILLVNPNTSQSVTDLLAAEARRRAGDRAEIVGVTARFGAAGIECLAEGAIATMMHDPAPLSYPSTTQMGLMHTAIGNQIGAYFTGEKSAADALAATEEDYIKSAKEAGVLQ